MENETKKLRSLYIPYAGPVLLEFPLLNKERLQCGRTP